MIKNLTRTAIDRLVHETQFGRRLGLRKIPAGSTIFVHIGKCGGQTVRDGLRQATTNHVDEEVHGRAPIYRPDLKYIIVARGPISRLKSAFRWRHRLVVEEESQKRRFKGEYEVLHEYSNLNNLAEALYHEDGSPNKRAQKQIRKIHHIREDIAYHIASILKSCTPDQINGVLMQENLNADIHRIFGYKNNYTTHRNPDSGKSDLSENALKHLKWFFHKDYESLTKLYCMGKIDREVFMKVM